MHLTKYTLMQALFTGGPLHTTTSHGKAVSFSIVNGVAREDGSGRSFNVTGIVSGRTETHHVRTVD